MRLDNERLRSRIKVEKQETVRKIYEETDKVDPEYMQLKFEEWKLKIMCITCKMRENEIILPCGHM